MHKGSPRGAGAGSPRTGDVRRCGAERQHGPCEGSANGQLVIRKCPAEPKHPHEPHPRTPETLDESGFGFVLIEALAGKWGVRQTRIGKAVWVELDARQPVNHP